MTKDKAYRLAYQRSKQREADDFQERVWSKIDRQYIWQKVALYLAGKADEARQSYWQDNWIIRHRFCDWRETAQRLLHLRCSWY